MRIAVYVGSVAGFLTVASFLPQVVGTSRTNQTRDLSVVTFGLLITAGALWITYGVLQSARPVVLTNVGMVSLDGAILVAKLRYR